MAQTGDRAVQDLTDALGGAVSTDSAVSGVAKRLLSYFTSGALEPGTRLPPERQLAASLGVGRSAVREALAALDILGIVTVRPGSGTYLRGTASELLPETLSWGLMLSGDRTHELIELRQGLEVQAAELAANRATPDSIARLRACVEKMRNTVDSLDAFVEADQAFHVELAETGGNIVVRDLLQTVRALLRVWADRVVRDPDDVQVALEQHIDVLNAIEARDPAAARHAMRAHMISAGDRLLRVTHHSDGSSAAGQGSRSRD